MARRAFQVLAPRTSHMRLLWAAAAGTVTWLVTPSTLSMATRAELTWIAGGVALLAIAGSIVIGTDSEATRRRAAADDPGRTVVMLIVLLASASSLFAALALVDRTRVLPAFEGRLLLGLSIGTVAVSWLLTHTAFTLRYAHLYYRGGIDDEGGLEFPGGGKPTDVDFAYFAFTIGMCFQVSDVAVTSVVVRPTVLVHAIMSFAYNTCILALSINIVVAQLN